ncbi:Enoyl-CoA hydratase/isomerase, partial [Rhizoctonia solani]
MSADLILVAKSQGVGVIKLNRPKALNALSAALIQQLLGSVKSFEEDDEVGAIVITGRRVHEKVFAAGADIKELEKLTFVNAYMGNFLQSLADGIAAARKPILAAVNGYALGGGCELAMMCDVIYAGTNAVFGQPEIKIGTIPGAGGTQRLIRAVGKAKAMHMVLTGESMKADEAEQAGLVAKIVPPEKTLEIAIAAGAAMASMSRPVLLMAKESVNRAEDLALSEGLRFERRLYHASFSTNDSKEGMRAFIQKRKPTLKPLPAVEEHNTNRNYQKYTLFLNSLVSPIVLSYMCKHILNAQAAIRAPCCQKWFDCPECHAETSDHPIRKTTDMVFMCKKCRKAFRKDMAAFEESDEYSKRKYYTQKIIEAKTPTPVVGVEGEDARKDARMLRDERMKQLALSLDDEFADLLEP